MTAIYPLIIAEKEEREAGQAHGLAAAQEADGVVPGGVNWVSANCCKDAFMRYMQYQGKMLPIVFKR